MVVVWTVPYQNYRTVVCFGRLLKELMDVLNPGAAAEVQSEFVREMYSNFDIIENNTIPNSYRAS